MLLFEEASKIIKCWFLNGLFGLYNTTTCFGCPGRAYIHKRINGRGLSLHTADIKLLYSTIFIIIIMPKRDNKQVKYVPLIANIKISVHKNLKIPSLNIYNTKNTSCISHLNILYFLNIYKPNSSIHAPCLRNIPYIFLDFIVYFSSISKLLFTVTETLRYQLKLDPCPYFCYLHKPFVRSRGSIEHSCL
jgi:hypothetical protein